MSRHRLGITTVIVLFSMSTAGYSADGDGRQFIKPDATTGSSLAVKVGRANLAHTEQMLPLDAAGKLVGKDKPSQQIEQALGNLSRALAAAGTNLDRAVKLNFYVANAAVAGQVEGILAARFDGDAKPAVSFVTTPLPHDAVVAVDAVAITPRGEVAKAAEVAVLPAGNRVYVSGQADRSKLLGEATRATLASLGKTLEFLRLQPGHVVAVKAFMTPMSEADVVRREVTRFFSGQVAPPLALVEWKSSLPIEIELVAASPADRSPADAGVVEYLTPPGMSASPVFCRVTRVNSPASIYVSGLTAGPSNLDGEAQVRDVFATLKRVVEPAGGDLRHLVKATYYVSDNDASSMLNKLRPKYYDPQRPPAASKAMVHGVGAKGRSLAVDMIAVPRP